MADPRAPKILIVDDDEAIADYLAGRLDRCGCRTDWAEDGEVGLWKAQTQRPDLILLDLAMPVLDGFAFLDRRRMMSALRSIPILVMSARHMEADVRRAIALGARDYLTKPFEETTFLRRLARHLPAGARFDALPSTRAAWA